MCIRDRINNVLQKPNVNSTTFTEGFAIEDNHKIVFKVAPTSEDIFWGSIIANTITTFDISDHKIDTFTGDGSTTEFTLSHTPANNESLMVTINGVLQHPSNASTTRAYTLIASIIQFTAAPGVGDEIQVRHLGFAGATTADVSGFYGRTGNVVLTTNDHIITGNINSSGIITASSFRGDGSQLTGIDATALKDSGGNVKIQAQASGAVYTGIHTFTTLNSSTLTGTVQTAAQPNITSVGTLSSLNVSGSVSVGGTLTYEDVTNIDSVGLVTAREGIFVPDNKVIHVGNVAGTGDLQIYHDTSHSYVKDVGTGDLILQTQGGGIYLKYGSDTMIYCQPSNKVELNYANSPKLATTNTGVTVTGTVAATSYTGDGSNLSGISVGITTEALVKTNGQTASLDLTKDDHKVTATGTVTIDVTGGTEAGSHTLRIVNSGIATVGFSTYFLFPSGGTPNLPTTSGAISLISFTVHRAGAVGVSTQLLSGASVNFS